MANPAPLALDMAVVTALDADATLTAFLGGPHTYSAELPPMTPPPRRYLILGSSTQGPFNTFMAPGSRVTLTLDGWEAIEDGAGNREVTKAGVLTLWGHVTRLLHEQPVAMSGHLHLVGSVVLLGVLKDPGGTHMHVKGRYEALSKML